MFEIGKEYFFETVAQGPEGTTYTTSRGRVLAVENTLLKIAHGNGNHQILNTASITFEGAQEVPELGEDSIFAPGNAPTL